jgi:hypothetical protein
MTTMLDIIGSVIVGGLVILGMSQFILDRQAAVIDSTDKTTAQITNESITSTMMYDLRKIGYNVKTTPVFLLCRPTALTALGDIDNNGVVDTIRYWWSGAVTSTPNPNDSLLFRKINNETTEGLDVGLTNLRFTYLNSSGSETTTPADVRAVQVSIATQGKLPASNDIDEGFSEFRISPRSINK